VYYVAYFADLLQVQRRSIIDETLMPDSAELGRAAFRL
jgi:hypothetical protein